MTWRKRGTSIALFLGMIMLTVLLPPAWGLYAMDEPYVEQARGHILYFPTINHADTAVASQAPSGIIPTSPTSKVATAWDSAGKMLELASAYRYTSDEKYLIALTRQWAALEAVKRRYGYYPEIMGIEGAAYSVNRRDVIRDGIFLSKAILGLESLAENVTATREVYVQGYVRAMPGECPGGDCAEAKEEPNCPYEGLSPTGEEKLRFVCSEGASTLLEVEYSLPPSKLGGSINASDINVVSVKYRGKEVAVGGGGLTGIRLELLPHAKKDMLRAIADEHLVDKEMRWGFSAQGIPDVLSFPMAMLGYQAKLVLLGEDSPPWEIVRYGMDAWARDYLRLTGEYSLLRGAIYLEGLARINATHSYEFTGKGSMEHANGEDWVITGSKVTYAHQGDKPRYEGITLKYRPVIDRRIHVAGTIEALLEAKFGATARTLGYVDTLALPSGIYNVTALREKSLEEEVLNGEVSIWKPTPYRDAEVVQFSTLSLIESERLYKKAIRKGDPVMFYIAADNLQIHSPRSTAAKAMLALLSLDPRQGEALAEELSRDPTVSYQKVIRVFEEFRRWYAREALEKAWRAVKESLDRDDYSAELEKTLMYLALEAEKTGLDSKEEMRDLYEGYRDYYGPHTKSYENLARMARHIPEYKGVVEAIEAGRYAEARSMLSTLPQGKVKEVLSQRLDEEDAKLQDIRAAVIEAVKTGKYSLAYELSLEYEDLGKKTNTSNPEISIIKGVAEGVTTGRITEENAKELLSNLEAFKEWKPKIPSTRIKKEPGEVKPSQEALPPAQAKEAKGRGMVIAVLFAVLVLSALAIWRLRKTDWWANRARMRGRR
jgi:hypothetical protein